VKSNFVLRSLQTAALIVIILCQMGSAQEHRRSPFSLKDFKISLIDSVERKAAIVFSTELLGTGEVSLALQWPKALRVISGETRTREGRLIKGHQIAKTWEVFLPKEGYYLMEVGLAFSRDESDTTNQEFVKYHSFPIYFEVKDGQIVSYGQTPDPKFTQPTEDDQREPKELKPRAVPVPFDTTSRDTTGGKALGRIIQQAANYNITVQISGQIKHQSDLLIFKGVPDVGVYLDWDYDNNPNTGYTPYYGGNTQHVDYDKTDNNGYYYFSFTFTGSQPANQYSPQIRVYANNANSAAFDGDLGLGAKFPIYHYINISSATTYVFSNTAHLTVETMQGGALRNLYRARVFSLNRLSFTPGQIRYYIRSVTGGLLLSARKLRWTKHECSPYCFWRIPGFRNRLS
jgi:hypothetical protein